MPGAITDRQQQADGGQDGDAEADDRNQDPGHLGQGGREVHQHGVGELADRPGDEAGDGDHQGDPQRSPGGDPFEDPDPVSFADELEKPQDRDRDGHDHGVDHRVARQGDSDDPQQTTNDEAVPYGPGLSLVGLAVVAVARRRGWGVVVVSGGHHDHLLSFDCWWLSMPKSVFSE